MSSENSSIDRLLKSPQLPSVPAVAVRLLELTRDPDSCTDMVVEVIKSDPALAVRILKSANSSWFGFRSEIRTLEQAVPLVGRTVITSLALSFSLANEAVDDGPLAEHYNQFWLRSIVQASAAETLSKHAMKGLGSELFMSGLLIDLGRLAMLKVLRSEYVPVLDEAADGRTALHTVEEARLGFTHAGLSAELMTRWKLPEEISSAARYHNHDPDDLPEELVSPELARAMIVVSAVGEYFCNGRPGESIERLKDLTARILNFDRDTLFQYLDEVDVKIRETASVLNTTVDEIPSPAELMSLASEQLAEIAIQQDLEHREITTRKQLVESEMRELEIQNRKLQEEVLRDPLTGLYNRRFFDETLHNELQRASRRTVPVGLLFIDVDHFKNVNDTYGHQFGDAVLMRIGEVLPACIRSSDTAARFGGEEFVVLIPDTHEQGVRTLAERIRHAIESGSFRHRGRNVTVTVSIGGTVALPARNDKELESRLLQSADAAMYESKRRGRNRVTVQSLVSELEQRISGEIQEHQFSQWLIQKKVVSAETMHEAISQARPEHIHIGELAHRRKWIEPSDVRSVLQEQELCGERFGTVAHRMGLLSDVRLASLLAAQREDSRQLADSLVNGGVLRRDEVELLLECFGEERDRCLKESNSGEAVDCRAKVASS